METASFRGRWMVLILPQKMDYRLKKSYEDFLLRILLAKILIKSFSRFLPDPQVPRSRHFS